jgi:hypothetical protein
MKDYKQYIKEFHNDNKVELDFISRILPKNLIATEDEIEQILDFLFANTIDISKV